MTELSADPVFASFTMNEDGTKVITCPMGHSPEKTTYYPKTGMCRTLFKSDCCTNCPNKDKCKGKQQRSNYAVHVSANMVKRAEYVAKLSTEEYLALARKRNAVEGIMSVLRRRYHIDDIPVFGYLRSRQFFWLKIGTYNFAKLINHNKRVKYISNLKIA
ncbi:MAG: transposase [Lachnospiraceae bacterium]